MLCNTNLHQSTPGVKWSGQVWPCWKGWNPNGWSRGSLLIGLKFWWWWAHCKTLYFGCSRSSDFDVMIKMTRLQSINIKEQYFVAGLSLSNFDLINIRDLKQLKQKYNYSCEVIMIKILDLFKVKARGHLFWFHNFLAKPILMLGHSIFTPGVFWLDLTSFFRKLH